MAATGLAAIGLHLWDVLLTLALLLLATACGRALLRRLDRSGALAEDTWVFALLVGAGAVSTAMLALGMIGALNRIAIGAVLLLLAGASHRGWRDIARRLAGEGRNAALLPPPFFAVSLLIGAFMVVESLAPPWDWDTLMYHLDVPRDYLEAGRVFLPPDNWHALYVSVVQFLYIPLMAFGGLTAPALLSTAFAVALAVLMGRYGQRVFGSAAGAAASALIWSSTMVVLVAVTPRIDVTLALLTFAAHCALWSAWRQASPDHLKLAGLLAGLAIAAKANAIPYVMGLAVAGGAVLLARRYRTRLRSLVSMLATGAALAAAVVLPWYLKNVVLTGSWTDVITIGGRLTPWLAELTGYAEAGDVPGLGRLAIHSQSREPFSIAAYFGAPASITIEGESVFYFAGVVLALAPLGLLVRGSRRNAAFFLGPPVLFLGLVLLRSATLNTRYLMPMMPPLTLVGAAVIASGLGVVARNRIRIAVALVAGLLLLPTAFAAGVTAIGHKAYRHALGLENGWQALERRRDVAVPRIVEDRLVGDDVMLMLGDAKGYLYAARVLQDNAVTNWPVLLAAGHTTDCLARTRITHVLMLPGSEEYFAGRGADLSPYRWNEFPEFADRCLEPLAEDDEYLFYRVR